MQVCGPNREHSDMPHSGPAGAAMAALHCTALPHRALRRNEIKWGGTSGQAASNREGEAAGGSSSSVVRMRGQDWVLCGSWAAPASNWPLVPKWRRDELLMQEGRIARLGSGWGTKDSKER